MSAPWEEAQRERSTLFMLRLLVALTRRLGRRWMRVVLPPTVLYFLLFAGSARRASRNYLRRVLPRPPTLLDTARHFYSFAGCALDRVVLLSDPQARLDVKMSYTPRAYELRESGRGLLMLLAHVGSFEAIRAKGVLERKLPLRIVMDREHGRMYTQLLEKIQPELKGVVLDSAERGPELVLRIKEAVAAGQIVCLMADRPRIGEPQVEVDFLGGRARLPASPWIMAGVLGVPVLVNFVLYRDGAYSGYVEDFSERIALPRGERLAAVQQHAQRYAGLIEKQLRAAPYNWFNFYDFWHETPAD